MFALTSSRNAGVNVPLCATGSFSWFIEAYRLFVYRMVSVFLFVVDTIGARYCLGDIIWRY